jgi:hypothetical protein
VVDARPHDRGDLNVRIGTGERLGDVVSRPSVKAAVDKFDVLLRHRLLPQAHGCEASTGPGYRVIRVIWLVQILATVAEHATWRRSRYASAWADLQRSDGTGVPEKIEGVLTARS